MSFGRGTGQGAGPSHGYNFNDRGNHSGAFQQPARSGQGRGRQSYEYGSALAPGRGGADESGPGTQPQYKRETGGRSGSHWWLEREVEVPRKPKECAEKWMTSIHNARLRCGDRDLSEFYDTVIECLSESGDPYWTTLCLVTRCPDYATAKMFKSGMTMDVVLGLKYFPLLHSPRLKRLQTAAFLVAFRQKNVLLQETICAIYEIIREATTFLPLIQKELDAKRFDGASQAINILALHSHFDAKEVSFPLLLQDKCAHLDAYLKDNVAEQRKLVQYLDFLSGTFDDPDQLQTIIDHFKIPGAKFDKIHSKAVVSRLVSKMAKKYNVPTDFWPNTGRSQDACSMRYILYKRYIEQSISEEDSIAMLLDVVGDDPKLWSEVVLKMASYNDDNGAAKWARRFDIPKRELPYSVRLALEEEEEEEDDDDDDDDTFPGASFRMPEDRDSTHCPISYGDWKRGVPVDGELFCNPSHPQRGFRYIEDPTEFYYFLYDMIKDRETFGIDCEWKPVFNRGAPTELSLLQLASDVRACVVDILVMGPRLQDYHWDLFVDLLTNKDIKKLGFSFNNDFKVLACAHPALSQLSAITTNLLDLKQLCDGILDQCPALFPYFDPTDMPASRGLDTYVELCLGVRLNKTYQMSNWNQRPLRQELIDYAGFDAYALVDIYRVLQMRANEFKVKLMSFLKASSSKDPSNNQKRQNSTSVRDGNTTAEQTLGVSGEIAEDEYKWLTSDRPAFVVDTMLQGLGHQLRLCGLDTAILENADDHDKAAKIALREKRIVLSSGKAFQRLKKLVPKGMCYQVECSMNAKEQLKCVLNSFKIQLTWDSIFGRCTACNGGHYLKLAKSDCRPFSRDGGRICISLGSLSSAVSKVHIPEVAWNNAEVAEFFVCTGCGKVYWEGSHRGRIASSLGYAMQ